MVLIIFINLLVFVATFLVIATLFRTPLEAPDESTFRIEIDNVNRHTMFEIVPLRPLLFPVYQFIHRTSLTGLKRHIAALLMALGNPNQYTAEEYLTICVVWGVMGALGFWLVCWSYLIEWSIMAVVLGCIIGFGAGFMVAYVWLRERAMRRLREISRRLPYSLDLISMAMEAGATFYEAAATVVRDEPEDPMNQELGMVVREIDFGRSRQDSLTHLGKRIPVDGLDGIISAILQAETLGTPLAEVLKLQANLLRMRRSMRAERKAGEAAVKMLVPSMLILMCVVLIMFAPIIVRFIRGDYFN
jgi:tight adherence protein C